MSTTGVHVAEDKGPGCIGFLLILVLTMGVLWLGLNVIARVIRIENKLNLPPCDAQFPKAECTK